MSANKYKPHVFILPEDDANRQLANGFVLEVQNRQIQVRPEAGGWLQVIETFTSIHYAGMRRWPARHMVLLIDFDDNVPVRTAVVSEKVPEDVRERVYCLGSRTDPEALKQAGLGNYESIGRRMASEWGQTGSGIWDHELLRHNANDLLRLKRNCRHHFFP